MNSPSLQPDAACTDQVHAIQERVEVVLNRRLARDTFLIRLHCPALAKSIRPGQFLMIRLDGPNDPLLGRPFALYDTVLNDAGEPIAVDVVYLVVGKGTSALSQLCVGHHVTIWGPLGNGFRPVVAARHVALVAGGIGQTPFLAYARELLGGRGYGGNMPQRLVDRKPRSITAFARRISPLVSRIFAVRGRSSYRFQRRLGGLSWVRDRPAQNSLETGPYYWMWTRTDVTCSCPTSGRLERAVRCIIGNTDGLRIGRLFQLRHQSQDARWLGLQTRLHRWPGL